MYYLNSRYYNPQSGLFISSDGIIGQTGDVLSTNMYAYCQNNQVQFSDTSEYMITYPTPRLGAFYSSYQAAVKAWAKKYAPLSKGVEYGAIIYKFRVLSITYYFIGETYKGFKTTNWYTVINGLGAGYLMGVARMNVVNILWPFTRLQIIGFVHTHPIGHNNQPSDPDLMMKNIGWFVGAKIFPIAVYNGGSLSINYF